MTALYTEHQAKNIIKKRKAAGDSIEYQQDGSIIFTNKISKIKLQPDIADDGTRGYEAILIK